jgi:hypothetical protein
LVPDRRRVRGGRRVDAVRTIRRSVGGGYDRWDDGVDAVRTIRTIRRSVGGGYDRWDDGVGQRREICRSIIRNDFALTP